MDKYDEALSEKQAALALADALRMELRKSRERCGKLEAALRALLRFDADGGVSMADLGAIALDKARAALNEAGKASVEGGQKP